MIVHYFFKEKLYKFGLKTDYLSFLIHTLIGFLLQCDSNKIKRLPNTGKLDFSYQELKDTFKMGETCSIPVILLCIIFLDTDSKLIDRDEIIEILKTHPDKTWRLTIYSSVIYTITVNEILDLFLRK